MIFIIGVGRSGTSLLQSILNSHSEISFLPETQFLRNYVFKKNILINESNYRQIIKQLENDSRFSRLNIYPELVIEKSENMIDVYKSITNLFLKNKNKKIVGDKDPKIIENIKSLNYFFPNSKIIHIIRDPRDVVLSRTKARWSKKYPYFIHSIIYYLQMTLGRKMLYKYYSKSNYYELKYEDLIRESDYELKKICNFLGVEYEKNILNYEDSSRELVSKDEFDWKKETFNPVDSKNFNKWKKEFNFFKILIIESICYYHIKENLYDFKNKLLPIKFLLIFIFKPLLFVITYFYKIKLKYFK